MGWIYLGVHGFVGVQPQAKTTNHENNKHGADVFDVKYGAFCVFVFVFFVFGVFVSFGAFCCGVCVLVRGGWGGGFGSRTKVCTQSMISSFTKQIQEAYSFFFDERRK